MDNTWRILVVDDEEMLSDMLKSGLEAFNHYCRTALNGSAALNLLRVELFDVMVTDIVMPVMDGFVLTRTARQLNPDLAVIVMTGFTQSETCERAIEAGASDFIKKPFTIAELLLRIDRIIRDRVVLREMQKKQEEAAEISRQMIAGLQDEAADKISKLHAELNDRKKTDVS